MRQMPGDWPGIHCDRRYSFTGPSSPQTYSGHMCVEFGQRTRPGLMPVFFCFGCSQLDRHDRVLTLIRLRIGDGVTLMSARHFSSPSMRQRLAARGSSPGGCREPGIQRRCKTKDFGDLIFRQKPQKPSVPRAGASAVLGRYALAEPGDCNAARRTVCGRRAGKVQEGRGKQSRHWALAAVKRRATASKEKAAPP